MVVVSAVVARVCVGEQGVTIESSCGFSCLGREIECPEGCGDQSKLVLGESLRSYLFEHFLLI